MLPVRSARGWRIAWLVPLVVCLAWSLLMRPEFASLGAPLFGPWAGYLYGHRECTLATVLPGWSFTLLGGGALALVAYPRARAAVPRILLATWIVAWSLAWSAFGVLSVLNSTS